MAERRNIQLGIIGHVSASEIAEFLKAQENVDYVLIHDDQPEPEDSVTATDEQYIEHKNKAFPAQLDITQPDHGVQVEYDMARSVLYVHVDGYTALRVCRIPKPVEFSGNSRIALPGTLTHGSDIDCPMVQDGEWQHCKGHKIPAR